LIYIGTVHLNRHEDDVWKMTPRKILNLWNRHAVFKGWKKEEEKQEKVIEYADDVPWL
jgi:hypothetical protein